MQVAELGHLEGAGGASEADTLDAPSLRREVMPHCVDVLFSLSPPPLGLQGRECVPSSLPGAVAGLMPEWSGAVATGEKQVASCRQGSPKDRDAGK